MTTLVSPGYLQQLRAMHDANRFGGAGALEHAPDIVRLANKVRATSVLDYGCGTGALVRALAREFSGWRIDGYDPGVAEFSRVPRPADVLVAIDVMEHVEPDCLDAVLAHMLLLCRRVGYFAIATRAAENRLPDGRNAHLIIDNAAWWVARFNAAGWRVDNLRPRSSAERAEAVFWANRGTVP